MAAGEDAEGDVSIRRRRGSEDATGHAGGSAPRPRTPDEESIRRRDGGEESLPQDGDGVVWDLILAPLRYLIGFNGNVKASTATGRFIDEFQQLTGHGALDDESNNVKFVRSDYRQALTQASRSEKLLFIYLHAGQHPDTPNFCINVLPQIADFVNDKMVAWGGCVEYAEPYQLCGLLNAATYPYIAILEPPANTRSANAKLVERIEGAAAAELIKNKLTAVQDHHESVMAERVAARFEAEERQRIRQEQDEALARSMEEDRRREEERLRNAQAEERAQQEAQERTESLQRKRSNLAPEPPTTTPRGEMTTIRFQLGDGSRFQRRFFASATMQQLRDYVDVELFDRNLAIENYNVVLNFPKKSFGPEDDLSLSLESNGLVPQAVLFVQDLDA